MAAVTALPLLLSACSSPGGGEEEAISEVSEALAGTALFVAPTTSLSAADTLLRNRLQTLGLNVVVKAASATVAADANGKILVVISSTVAPADVGSKFRNTTTAVVTWESQIYDDMGMTSTATTEFGTEASQLNLTILTSSQPHAMAAGRVGSPTVATSFGTFSWGKPNSNAIRIAAIPGQPTKAAIFAYGPGWTMPGLVAPGARVGFFFGDTTASVADADGAALFDAAITWAATANGDSDGDGLRNAVETNLRVFVDNTKTGTNPNNADTDGDALRDGDEVLGTTAGLNLPAMGTNPLRRDILLEHDWFSDSITCGTHSHRPPVAAIDRVTAAFAAAPVTNLNGSNGINVIHDYGQGGVFTGGNLVADANGVIQGDVAGPEYQNHKASNLAAARLGYFHYVLHMHNFNTNSGSTGVAEIVGDDLIVSLQCSILSVNVANTIMHELGHNLGLRHGGDVNTNNKPNYNSVMNYLYQFAGVDTNCVSGGDGVLDYGRNQRAALNEAALSETAGICNGVDWDWNGNGAIDAATVVADINADFSFSTLTDHNDWGSIVYNGVGSAAAFSRAQQELVTCDNPVPRP